MFIYNPTIQCRQRKEPVPFCVRFLSTFLPRIISETLFLPLWCLDCSIVIKLYDIMICAKQLWNYLTVQYLTTHPPVSSAVQIKGFVLYGLKT